MSNSSRFANWPPERRAEMTLEGRRAARYHYAARRIDQILAGDPPLTAGQRQRLAAKLVHPAGKAGDNTAGAA